MQCSPSFIIFLHNRPDLPARLRQRWRTQTRDRLRETHLVYSLPCLFRHSSKIKEA
jgi:hypothetical protein